MTFLKKKFPEKLSEFSKLVGKIKVKAQELVSLSDEELLERILKIQKSVLHESDDKSNSFLISWFAIVQEISYRIIGLKHYDTQLLAGIFLHQGKIVEMKTGEGKTLVSTLPLSFNALKKRGSHLITVNPYLAERDQKWMGKIYEKLSLTTGLVTEKQNPNEKRKNYNQDITYITNSELVFDYLRDNTSSNLDELVQPSFYYGIIDEVDSILIDEARTPLIISEIIQKKKDQKLPFAFRVIQLLKKGIHFEIDEKRRDVFLTEEGYFFIEQFFKIKDLYDVKNPWAVQILNALKAKYLYKLNKDYVIINQQIVIVDEFTGRIMPDRKWSLGLHQAIELKEKLLPSPLTKTQTSITYQSFFPLYPKLSGMTGTAMTDEKEFLEIYNLEVVPISTIKPVQRKDLPDVIYQTELSKWKAVLNKAIDCYQRGQPILIGTSNIEKSEFLSQLFSFANLPHQLLNARPENVERESEIIAQAGKPSSITIATNMAGRGTDICLGGNIEFNIKEKIKEELFFFFKGRTNGNYSSKFSQIIQEYKSIEELKQDIKNLPYSFERLSPSLKILYEIISKEVSYDWVKTNEFVKLQGGLFVLGTERSENRRIDDQLRGRSGRQGDPGISQFFLSLEDELIRIFGGENIQKWVSFLIDNPDEPLESNFLSQSIANAQKKIESYNFDIRKKLIEYEYFLDIQRQIFSTWRKDFLKNILYEEKFLRISEIFLRRIYFTKISSFYSVENFLFFSSQNHELFRSLIIPYSFVFLVKKDKKFTKRQSYQRFWSFFNNRLLRANYYQKNLFQNTFSIFFLEIIDYSWTAHLERLNYIRDTINWKSYGQQNPLDEYNLQSISSFSFLMEEIALNLLYSFLRKVFIF
jgi:preprotein translocase subunit SecA